MPRKVGFVALAILAAALPAGVVAAQVIEPDPYVEVDIATAGPLSLMVSPDGNGPGFGEASTGEPTGFADATITMTLYDYPLPDGEPIASFPAEDLWLATDATTFHPCPGGTIPDHDTDANGMTTWSAPPFAGGWFEPAAGHELKVSVLGYDLPAPALQELRFNSPDLSGDQQVNIADVATFADDYFDGYRYRSDLAWDGVLNLADVRGLAAHLGAACP